MRVAVLGASGKVGQQLVTALLERGHKVAAMTHSRPLDMPDTPNLTSIQGDVHSLEDIKKAISGCDIVVSTLGSWGTKSKDIVSAATNNLVPAMSDEGIKRFVSVTGAAAKLPDEKLTFIQSATRKALSITGKPILKDAEEHLDLLTHSNLDWTAIRAPIMTNKNSAAYKLSRKALGPLATVSRHAVVLALVDAIENNTFPKQAPFISVK